MCLHCSCNARKWFCEICQSVSTGGSWMTWTIHHCQAAHLVECSAQNNYFRSKHIKLRKRTIELMGSCSELYHWRTRCPHWKHPWKRTVLDPNPTEQLDCCSGSGPRLTSAIQGIQTQMSHCWDLRPTSYAGLDVPSFYRASLELCTTRSMMQPDGEPWTSFVTQSHTDVNMIIAELFAVWKIDFWIVLIVPIRLTK